MILKNPSLVTIALALGAYLLATRAYALFDSERAMAWIKAFPRNRRMAPFLTAVVILWTAWWVHRAAGESESFKAMQPLVIVSAPVVWVLLFRFMDSFLNARAFSALLLLLARPVVMSAFVYYSALRLPITLIGYTMAVSGIIFGFSRICCATSWAGRCGHRLGSVSSVGLGFCSGSVSWCSAGWSIHASSDSVRGRR